MSGHTTGRLSSTAVKIALLTREYPPEVYGGAGVHVEYLAAALGQRTDVEVRCFGAPREAPGVRAFEPWDVLKFDASHSGALQAMSVSLAMAVGLESADVVHSHTWYAQFGGHVAKLLYDVPHVATTHSLEPLRRWKSEQLGSGGYAVSSFCERTGLEGADAVIAVSAAMREDILECYPALDPARVEVIHNGIDPDEYRPDAGTVVLKRLGIDRAAPYVAFVGRITRQKGLVHLLDASLHVDADAQIVLCAGAPDTKEIAREVAERVEVVRERRGNIVWIEKMLTKPEVIQILSHATVFCCPSIYEPLGIVNLEAMACGTAVVATATGGIPEVVEEGSTGYLVPFDPEDPVTRSPRDPESFARAIAGRLEKLLSDPATAKAFGDAGRRRAIEHFSWEAIADKTIDLYRRVRVAI
jgi:alpha-maltose-1-phosphate synthase